MKKYRVYEAINSDGEKFQEHGHFDDLKDAQIYATMKRWRTRRNSTFIINYKNDEGKVCEQYYGDWTN